MRQTRDTDGKNGRVIDELGVSKNRVGTTARLTALQLVNGGHGRCGIPHHHEDEAGLVGETERHGAASGGDDNVHGSAVEDGNAWSRGRLAADLLHGIESG